MKLTYYFKDIFPDYTSWKGTLTAGGIYTELGINDYTVDQFIYNRLIRAFRTANIRYRDPNDFICELENRYINYYNKFKKEKSIIESMYSISDSDIQLVSDAISNFSDYPNEAVTDATAPLNFITRQTFNHVKNNKIRAYLEALNGMETLRIEELLNEFRDLFMSIEPFMLNTYGEEEE